MTRTSVLEADSAAEETTVRGTHMFQLGIGSTFRFPIGGMPSAVPGQPDAAVTDRFRLVNPADLQLGYPAWRSAKRPPSSSQVPASRPRWRSEFGEASAPSTSVRDWDRRFCR